MAWLSNREHKLLQHFFPPLERGGLPLLLDPLCSELVDTVRPIYLKMVSVEELCSIALILKGESLCVCAYARGPLPLSSIATIPLGREEEREGALALRSFDHLPASSLVILPSH